MTDLPASAAPARGLARRPASRDFADHPAGGSRRQVRVAARRTRMRGEAPVVLLLMAGLAIAWFSRAWALPLSHEIGAGQGNDSNTVMWFLGWFAYALSHGHNPLVSHYALYPSGVNAMWNTSMPLLSTLLTPVTLAFGVVTSYNVVATAGPALSAWVAYLAFRRWTGLLPAVIGGLVFGFSPFMAAESFQHPFLTFAVTAPLFLIVFDRLVVLQEAPAWRDGLYLGLLAWAQLLISEEMLAMEVMVAVVGLAVLALCRPAAVTARRLRHILVGGGVGVVVWAVLSAVPLAIQLRGPARVSGPLHPSGVFVTDLWNFITPSLVTAIHTHSTSAATRHFTGNFTEWAGYVGIPLLAFVLLSLILCYRRTVTWVAFGIAVGAAVLSLGSPLHIAGRVTGISLPWAVIAHIPKLRDVLPSRLSSLMFLGIGLLVALGLDELAHRRLTVALPGFGLCALGLVAFAPRIPFPALTVLQPTAFTKGAVCPKPAGSDVVVLPIYQQSPLVWQADAGFCYTMPSGVGLTESAALPRSQYTLISRASLRATFHERLPVIVPSLRAEVRAEFNRWGTKEIVLGPIIAYQPQRARTELAAWVSDLVGARPRNVDGALVWAHPHVPATGATGG